MARSKSLACLLLLTVSPLPAFAQDSAGSFFTLPLLIVSATAIPTPADQIGSSVTVVTAEQIEQFQRRSVPDLLQTVPGLNVVQAGSPGGQTSVFMRGTNSNHVKVLIDGIDVSDPSNPTRSFDFGALKTADIERLEVLRGPQSGLYGADALGGVISITTKKGSGPAKLTTMAEGGALGTFNKTAQLSGGTDRAHYAFTASNYLSSSVPVTPLELLGPGQRRLNDYTNNWTYTGKLGADLSDIFSLNFVGRYTDAKLLHTNFDFDNRDDSESRQFSGLADGAWRLFDGKFNSHAGVAYTDVLRNTFAAASGASRFDGDRIKYYWKSDLALAPGQTLLAGVERETERARTNTPFGGLAGENTNTGYYAELQSRFGDRVFVASNIRHDENESFGGHNTWRIAPALLIPETQTKLKASYGTGFHAPSLSELFDPFFGNPNLRPETSRGYDFGFEQFVWQRRAQFGVTWFRNDIEDLIAFGPGFIPININQARTHGFEAFVAAQVSDRFWIRADYTQTTAIDLATGLALLRRPHDKTSVTAIWQATDKLTLSATALWVSDWVDGDRITFGRTLAPGYNTINIAANYLITEKLVAFARIDNLLDERHQNPLGFERPGFTAYAGLRLSN